MSAGAVYQALGLGAYEVLGVEEDADELLVLVAWPREKWRCSACGSRRVHCHDWKTRLWRSAPVGLKTTRVAMDVPRLRCLQCNAVRRHQPAFASGSCRHTLAFERYAAQLLNYLTISDLTRHLGISWHTAMEIDRRRLEALPRPQLCTLKRLAIDEVHSGRQHGYLTIVLDLDTGVVVHVGDGRGAAALEDFFRRLKQSRAKVQAVAIDMSGGYIAALRKHLPKVPFVFDRFHVVKLMNEKLTDLRRELFREATDGLHRQVLKGTRWLLLMGSDTLDSPQRVARRKAGQPSDRKKLDAALKLNEPLATAYYLKEKLRLFWDQSDRQAAQCCLEDWCAQAESSGIRVLHTMARTLRVHEAGLLAWYDHPISTGPLEGTNNKIKLLQHRAYGYRNREHFRLRILTLHHTRHRLTG